MPSERGLPCSPDGNRVVSRAARPEAGPPNLFAVITWGCAGTKWLTQALNGHPDIFCVHALRFCLSVRDGVAESLDDVAVLSAVERMGTGHRAAGEVHGLSRTSVGRL